MVLRDGDTQCQRLTRIDLTQAPSVVAGMHQAHAAHRKVRLVDQMEMRRLRQHIGIGQRKVLAAADKAAVTRQRLRVHAQLADFQSGSRNGLIMGQAGFAVCQRMPVLTGQAG